MKSADSERLILGFNINYKERESYRFFSSPGRTEIGGNHTDHQHGKVLAASLNLCITAVCDKNDENVIRIKSEGYPEEIIDLSDLSQQPSENFRASALIRGIAARFKDLGYNIGGFDAYTVSNVLKGSGMSSSAAFEVLIAEMLNALYNDNRLDKTELAKSGQWAENNYFKKPCGLMDQLACAVGGLISIDFLNPDTPVITPVNFDFSATGYKLCIIDTGADHSDLTENYAAITTELRKVSNYFGKEYLRDVSYTDFMNSIPALRKEAGDRAVLRAIHFYDENERVSAQIKSLESGDFDRFLALVRKSGESSYMYLQNVIPIGNIENQEVALALAICDKILGDRGAFRVHGGGFAGTIQAFVPEEMSEFFKKEIENILGEDSCNILDISKYGVREL